MRLLKKFKSCGCCCSLAVGTKIILWLTVFCGTFSLGNILIAGCSEPADNDMEALMIAFYSLSTLQGLVAAIALYGVFNKNASLVLPYIMVQVMWLITYGFVLIVLIIAIMITVVLSWLHINTPDLWQFIPVLVCSALAFFGTISSGIIWCCTSVVHSYYCELKENTSKSETIINESGPEQGEPGYSYPPSYEQVSSIAYAPAYDLQPAAVYPQTPAWGPAADLNVPAK